ncbi:MAG TPA: hypothetical protein PLE19_17710 [Planctomycetota bacterium]|nr:hypothetical protein [Planctomycetota bacterium]HRR80745.1 hypothetical protein [Planctomycetota bacterium]HRT95443.1 hypothetical protein [Planctomycetota bacterium]
MAFARAEVQTCNGVPTLVVEGQPLHGMTATSCAFDDPAVVRGFVEGGAELLMIWIEAGIHCWKGEGSYDWGYAERKLAFFEQHGGDTRWIIRVRLGLLAPWFAQAYPSEVHKGGDLSVCNIASSVWCEKVCGLVRDFVAWLKTTRWAPRIIGFMLNAGSTEEWLIFDTDETTRGRYHGVYPREFRAWLRRTYADEAALRAAWNDPKAAFDTATCPTGHLRKGSHIWGPFSLRDPAVERPAIDYYRFLNTTLADHLIAVCRAAKEAAGTPILCGGFHSYLWWETGVYSYIQEYGHGLIQRLKDSPWVDFVSDITSYDGRYPGGPSGYLGLPHSLHLGGKLHYTEVDLVTVAAIPEANLQPAIRGPQSPPLPDKLWKWDLNFCGRDMDEQIALLQREHAHNLVTGTPYWWFDIRCRNYTPPPIVAEMKRLSDIGKRAVEWNRRSASQVAFVCSEDTPMFQAAMSGELIRFELECHHPLLLDLAARQWGLAGVPFDTYELHDLAHPDFPGDQYRLLVFVNCAYVSPRAAEGIRRWQNGDRVFCWTYAAAVLDETRLDPATGAELVGLRLGWKRERRQIRVMVDDSGYPLTRGGEGLSFGTEGSVGPVFFADDPEACVFGRLRDGGEPAFALRHHDGWRSVYLAMLNFGPKLLRNLARFAGAHVWCESDDVIYANRSLVCLHTASAGDKVIRLPRPAIATDLWTCERSPEPSETIRVAMPAYRTRLWRLTPP